MTKEEKKLKRIEVCKDVLKNIKYLDIKPGTLCIATKPTDIKIRKDNSKEVAAKLQKKDCHVCALGACFISNVKLNNKFDFSNTDHVYDENSLAPNSKDIEKSLKNIFSVAQFRLIECCFEDNEGIYYMIHKNKEIKAFYNKYSEPVGRLKAIMKNIIKNDGTFVV